jgi:hypothetical protein
VDVGLAELAAVRVHRRPAAEFDPAVGDERRASLRSQKPSSSSCISTYEVKWS